MTTRVNCLSSDSKTAWKQSCLTPRDLGCASKTRLAWFACLLHGALAHCRSTALCSARKDQEKRVGKKSCRSHHSVSKAVMLCVENVLIRRWCGLQELVWNFVIQNRKVVMSVPGNFEGWGKSTVRHAKVDGENSGISGLNKSFWDLRSPLLGTQVLLVVLLDSSVLPTHQHHTKNRRQNETDAVVKGWNVHAALPRFSWQC